MKRRMRSCLINHINVGAILSILLLLTSVSWAAPTVTYVEPQDGSVQPITATATAIFSETMDPASITSGSFTLSRPSGIISVAAGYAHTIALRDDGTVVAWGSNGTGGTNVPADLTGVKEIAAGHSHSVALNEDGTVVAWGNDSHGQSTVPTDLTGVTAISAGSMGMHTLALKDNGTVVAWGKNSEGQCNVPIGLSGVKAIAAGSYHSMALKEDGTVVAWGLNRYGQTDVPAGLTGVTAIASGHEHSLALKDDGSVVAWGWNSYGQSTVPTGLYDITAISAGLYHSVALRGNTTAAAWGDNTYDQCNISGRIYGVTGISAGGFHSAAVKNDGTVFTWGYHWFNNDVPMGLSGVKSIDSYNHTLALEGDGSVVAWGYNDYGQADVPTDLAEVVDVSAGQYHSLALKQDGTVVAWGANSFGQATVPAGLSAVTAIDAGDYHSVALKQDGTVTAWGYDGSYGTSTVPIGLSGITAIAAGGYHTVALKQDGTVSVWGRSDYGEADIPVGLSGVTAIAAGLHTLALKDDGTVVAWGYNQYGQTDVPAGLAEVRAIAAGEAHSVALKEDGSVVAWGYNNNGQCTVPAGLTDFVAIAAGEYSTLALKKDGTFVGWGNDGYGQSSAPQNPYLSPIQGNVAFDEFTNTAIFTPDSPLTPNTSYQVTVNTGVQNLNGDHMANNTSWGFVTDSQKLTATATLDDLDQTYDGATKTVTVTTNPIGLKVDITYNGSTTLPIEAGIYSVDATINDKVYEGSAVGTLIINKAAATINISDLVHTYDGSAKAATVTTVPAGLAVDITYSPDASPINAGSYDITATISEPNYQGSNTEQQLIINKAFATVSLNDMVQTYDTSPRVVTTTTVPAGLNVDLLYDNVSAAPTNAGTYSVDATINENNYYGSLYDQTLLVNKAAATINFTDLVHTYDGNSKAATVTTVPAGLAVDVVYAPEPAPTNAGTYDISALIVEQNYQGSDSTQDLVINQATQSITNNCPTTINKKDEIINLATCTSSTGNPALQVMFVVTSGPGLLSGNDLSPTDNKGQIVVTASKVGDLNYLPATDVQMTFDIVSK